MDKKPDDLILELHGKGTLIKMGGYSPLFFEKEEDTVGDFYCDDCIHLDPKEHEEVVKGVGHICKKHNRKVEHHGQHPLLPRLAECLVQDSKERDLTEHILRLYVEQLEIQTEHINELANVVFEGIGIERGTTLFNDKEQLIQSILEEIKRRREESKEKETKPRVE